MRGTVNAAREAVISITVQGPSGLTREVEAVIDTGFSEFLTLPSTFIAELGLPYIVSDRVALADGSEVTIDVHSVTAIWDGQTRYVVSHVADAMPLAGMKMLDGYDLRVEVKPGGRVAIRAITEP